MAAEKKRLFVGGLNAGTTEQDVRERFKSFGSVETVELHKVQKKEGFPEKTFAYVNIDASETAIKRCVSLLSNSKWRGGILKIELAKESFLSRLKKERELLATEKAKITTHHSSTPSLPKELQNAVRNAVPGTLIEGQKNWIVGKFGRALPVVHMRSKHGKKILKFDPSKTVHNLKRFKEDEVEGAQLSQLTWSLGPQRKYPWESREVKCAEFSPNSDDEDSELHGQEKRKFEKKSKKSRRMNKRVVGLSDGESNSDSYERTAKKKNKIIISKQNRKQDLNGVVSSSVDSGSDDNHEIRKKKKKVSKPEKSQKQDHSSDCNSISQRSSSNEREWQKNSKQPKKKKEYQPDKDASDIDYSGNESSTTKTSNVHQCLEQNLSCDGQNMGIDDFNEGEINLKPKKQKKYATKEEMDSNDFFKIDVISTVKSSVTKKKKKRKSTNNEELSLTNSLDSDNGNVISKGEVVNDSKTKQKKNKDCRADANKDSCQSAETDVGLQVVLIDDSSKKSNKKKKQKESKNRIKQGTIIEFKEEISSDNQSQANNNNTEKAKGNSKRQKEHLFESQDENDDKINHKQLTFKEKKAKLIDKETEKLSKEQKERNNQMNEKGSGYYESNDEEDCSVVSNGSNDGNNNKYDKTKQLSPTEDFTKTSTVGLTKEYKNKTLAKSNNKNNKTGNVSCEKKATTKKLTSNEKRLKAIKEKEMNTNTMQSIVSSALQNIDKTDLTSNARHITFDDDGDDAGDDDGDDSLDAGDVTIKENKEDQGKHDGKDPKPQVSGKISGSKASSWLGLDSDSDSDDEVLTFDAKPQFEGRTGQKLFELQKTYRGDSRFQLDNRFAESDEDGEEISTSTKQNGTSEDTGDVDKVSKQLCKEKDMAMSVLRGILGENFGTKHDSNSRKQKFKDSNSLRYDPARDDHAQFEQSPKKDSSPKPTIKETQLTSEDVMHSSNIPEVGNDKYYDVNTDVLTKMFSNKNKEDQPTSFTFLSNQNDDDENSTEIEWGQAEILKSKPAIPVMLPYDSSGDEQDNDDLNDGQQQTSKHSLSNERFFFHFGDPDLESEVYNQENVFMRTETLDQLNQHWVNVRSELTHDYKKKHKDALRRQSKMAAKRARMR